MTGRAVMAALSGDRDESDWLLTDGPLSRRQQNAVTLNNASDRGLSG